jgi:hypothetical protein
MKPPTVRHNPENPWQCHLLGGCLILAMLVCAKSVSVAAPWEHLTYPVPSSLIS